MLRFVVLGNALVLYAVRADHLTRPRVGLACVAVMVVWTPLASWLFVTSRRRTVPLLALDLGLAVGLILLSPVVKGPGMSATVPGFWVIGALLAWAVHYRWPGGLVAAGALAVADVSVRQEVTQANAGNVFLLVIGGVIVGSMAESLQLMAADRDRAERAAAAAAERVRLARVVHDGVLQVLGLVQRRSRELGGEAAELGRLAGEQEVALRTLVRAEDAATVVGPDRTDLAAALVRLGSRPGVEVAAPGHPVVVRRPVAEELTAAVAACLDNTARHSRDGVRSWVLLEDWPDRVEVSVRDDGPGFAAGRLEAAEAEGRLGVSQSIRGRIADLGGTAHVTSDADGTEWELVVPKDPAGAGP